jgi:HEAT repeat protein
LKLLHAAHSTIAIAAVEALGQLVVNEVIPPLVALLPNQRPGLRPAAIPALGRLRAREAIDGLQRLQG